VYLKDRNEGTSAAQRLWTLMISDGDGTVMSSVVCDNDLRGQ
jgi:hypothetical protein